MKNYSWGAIFDWDGVIIDSAAYHEESWERLAMEEKKPLPPGYFQKSFGMKNERIIPEILRWSVELEEIKRVSLRKEACYREILKERGIQALPGVLPWLKQLKRAGIPCVVGSSTHRRNIEVILDLIGLNSYFSDLVTSEDVVHGKPHPEVFLAAAKRINRLPWQCVVFEDAHVGIEAAHAGQMRAVAVTTTHPRSSFKTADLVVRQLDELSVDQIDAWFAKS